MSSGRRHFVLLRHPPVVDNGCGCRRRRRTKLASLLSSSSSASSKPTTPKTHNPSSPSTATATTTATTTATSSSCGDTTPSYSAPASPMRRRPPARRKEAVEESVAVVKESWDPYLDFRDSMVEMIVEKRLHAWEDLRGLLHRLLALNSPRHHHLILRAFAEIWNAGLLSSPPPPSPA